MFMALAFGLAGTIVVAFVGLGGSYTANRSSGAGAFISLTFNTDGSGSITGSVFTTVNFTYATPVQAGNGNNLYARWTETITLNNGSAGGTTSGNLAASVLSSVRTYTVNSDVLTNTITASLFVEIADSLAFTNILDTKTVVLTANRA